MTTLIRALALSLLLATFAAAQTSAPVRDVDLCELDLHPKQYDGQFVRVHGNINFEFEDFTIYAQCKSGKAEYPASIWLVYGGDEPEAATYCCGGRSSEPGNDLTINGHRVGLVRDSEFQKLKSRLEAFRLARPSGSKCFYGEADCRFYTNISATLTGLFYAKTEENGVSSGYGHFGTFHLLAIQQVSDVKADRTEAPIGGQFRCEQQTWQTDCPYQPGYRCSVTDPSLFEAISVHWNDSADLKKGWSRTYGDADGTTIGNWSSPDLLLSYSTAFPTRKGATPSKLTVKRHVCTPVSDQLRPARRSANVSCKTLARSWQDDRSAHERWSKAWREENATPDPVIGSLTLPIEAEAAAKLFAEGDQTWRQMQGKAASWYVLQKQAKLWNTSIDAALDSADCREEDALPNTLFSGCDWLSPDGMRQYSVGLMKYQAPKSKDDHSDFARTPWMVTDISTRRCEVERQ